MYVLQRISFVTLLFACFSCTSAPRSALESSPLEEAVAGNGVSGEGEQFLFTTQFPQLLALGSAPARSFLKDSVVIPALRQAYGFPESLSYEIAKDCVPAQLNVRGYRSANVYLGSFTLHATYEPLAEAHSVGLSESEWNIRSCSPDLILIAYHEGCRDTENARFEFRTQDFSCALTDLPDSITTEVRGYLEVLAYALSRSHVRSVSDAEAELTLAP